MRYSLTLRTYDPSDCADVGLRIRANKTTVCVEYRTRWQGSREISWILRDMPDGIATAHEIYRITTEESLDAALATYGLYPDQPDYAGPVIR